MNTLKADGFWKSIGLFYCLFEVIQAILGRLRIRVPRLGFDDGYALRLQGLMEAVNDVTGVRLISAARSLSYNERKNGSMILICKPASSTHGKGCRVKNNQRDFGPV